jgi:pilus assembly protein CpaF
MSLIQRVERAQQGADLPKAETELVVAPPAPPTVVRTPAREELLRGITLLLQQEVTRSFGSVVDVPAAEIRPTIEGVVDRIIGRQGFAVTRAERLQLIDQMIDEITGLGPLETLLADPTITEIMVNGPDDVFIERDGQIMHVDASFGDEAQLYQTIDRIVSQVNRRVDESSPMVDARLPTGERVNVIIPPLALRGPTMTIRRFPRLFTLDQLTEMGSLDAPTTQLLRAVVEGKLNVVISGGTGAGKTTLLNAMSAAIPPGERIITVEDNAELRLQQPHVVTLEARPSNVEGKGEVSIRDLVRNSLRMRPDRIIVGEVRGAETLDMLQALNTGHEGSLVTVHANSPDDAIHRLETLATMSDLHIPFEALRDQINSAIHVIVQIDRFADGRRRIAEVAIVASTRRETFRLGTVARFEADPIGPDRRVTGSFRHFPLPPAIHRRMELMGLAVPAEFGPDADLEQTPVRKAS